MSSLFKSKRSGADSKSSSKSFNVTESDSKSQKNASSAASSKSGAVHSPPAPPVSAGGGAAPNSKPNSQPRDQKSGADMQAWLETDCPIDSRIMAATMHSNTLSISRSGRFKAKGKLRARLFSEDTDVGAPDGHANQGARGSSSLSTPEDRQTVLDAMAKRSGVTRPSSRRSPAAALSPPPPAAAAAAGGNPSKPESGASKKSSDRETSAKWTTTTQSTDL